MNTLRIFLAIALASASGCADDELPHFGELQYESENFEVWASEGLKACGGTYEFTEGWLAAFRDRIGEYASYEYHTFYWLTPEEYDSAPCRRGATACAYDRSGVVYSKLIPAEHELVHIELGPRSRPPSILVEGAAEVFGSIESPDRMDIAPLDTFLDEEVTPGFGYETAGRFSRFIIDRFGMDRYFELYNALDGQDGRAALEAGVQDILGVEFSTLQAEFDAQSCAIDSWRFYDYECTALPLVPWESEARWSHEIDLACERDDVLGPRRQNEIFAEVDSIWTLRAFEVTEAEAEAGSYRLGIESTDETAKARIFECNRTCATQNESPSAQIRTASVSDGGLSTVLALNPGRYWMRIEHAADSDASVRVVIQ